MSQRWGVDCGFLMAVSVAKILVDFSAAAKLTEKQLRSHKGEYMAIIKLEKWTQEDQQFK